MIFEHVNIFKTDWSGTISLASKHQTNWGIIVYKLSSQRHVTHTVNVQQIACVSSEEYVTSWYTYIRKVTLQQWPQSNQSKIIFVLLLLFIITVITAKLTVHLPNNVQYKFYCAWLSCKWFPTSCALYHI